MLLLRILYASVVGLTTAVDLIKGIVRGITVLGDLVGPSDSFRKSNKYNELTPALPSFVMGHSCSWSQNN